MNRLYAPWRTAYTRSAEKSKSDSATTHDCVFCKQILANNDADNFVLGRYKHTFVLLNLYPYNPGHILILPYRHSADLSELTIQEQHELLTLTSLSQEILKQSIQPQGFNIGINLGKAAGASIPSHLHMHLLPRWIGDTNFLPTLAETKQISSDLQQLYQQMLPLFQEVTIPEVCFKENNHEK